jgi:hypothetical protein
MFHVCTACRYMGTNFGLPHRDYSYADSFSSDGAAKTLSVSLQDASPNNTIEPLYIYAYIHTHTHTYGIHTYIHTFIHNKHIHTYIHTHRYVGTKL